MSSQKPSRLSIVNTCAICIIAALLALLTMDHFESKNYLRAAYGLAVDLSKRVNELEWNRPAQAAAAEPSHR